LWRPRGDDISATQYAKFVHEIGLFPELDDRNALDVYRRLHQWTVENPGAFWRALWRFSGLIGNLGDLDFVATAPIWDRPFFPEGELSFAENVLQVNRCQDQRFANSTALITIDESGETQTISRGELLQKVLRFTRYLRQVGVGKGDRVAALLPNRAETVIGLLATSACGAIWSCCSPDFGDDALLDRFSQIRPKLFLSATRSRYAGKSIEMEARVCQLLEKLPSVEQWLIVGSPQHECPKRIVRGLWSDIDASEAVLAPFEKFSFNQPLYILYSSGTTGKPKCIVHGAGGSLLQHVKEHQLHLNMTSQDSLLYYTSTGWMMWNWVVSALASTETIVLYDGSPIAPRLGALWEASERCRVSHFGASARYFAAIEKEGYKPKIQHDLSRVRCVMSTGSPLLPDQFGWLYENVGSNIQLASISGGTDIVSCFVLGNPTIPVHAGEIQCRGFGMDVRVWDAHGKDLIEQPGELVCANAFPSMPVGFWGDEDRSRFRSAYFSRYDNAWWHGDWVKETKHGGFVIYGRSDATLNPGGVRIGTGEIYQQVSAFEEISEAVATVLRREGDEKIVLFVKLQMNNTLTEELIDKIKSRLRKHCSPRHVPAYIVSAPDFPRTLSGKISEIAVRNALLGCDIGNVGALANPECLEFFSAWAKQV